MSAEAQGPLEAELPGEQPLDAGLIDGAEAARAAARARAQDRRGALFGLVLSAIEDAVCVVEPSGRLSGELSESFARRFPMAAAGRRLSAVIAAQDDDFAARCDGVFEGLSLRADPAALALIPTTLHHGGAAFHCRALPLIGEDGLEGVVVVISAPVLIAPVDSSAAVADALALGQAVVADLDGVLERLDRGRALVGAVVDRGEGGPALVERMLGFAAEIGAAGQRRLADAFACCGAALGGPAAGVARATLGRAWAVHEERVEALARGRADRVEVSAVELLRLRQLIQGGASADLLLSTTYFWGEEPAVDRLRRIAARAAAHAGRLGRVVELQADAQDQLRVPAGRFGRLWEALARLVEEEIARAIEIPDDRQRAGKGERAHIALRARACARPGHAPPGAVRLLEPAPGGESWVLVELTDDGRGVHWPAVVAAATAAGLPCATPAERVAALFSGAVGPAQRELRDALAALGGCVELSSRAGVGAHLALYMPLTDVDQRAEGAR
ncbi:MAG: hypothetical protein JNM72_28170 [Deltaproteobacteria bacterium]|nr:hypothetical protein [Deltaproteobacteria bacterium]